MIFKNADFIYDSEKGVMYHGRNKGRAIKKGDPCSTKPTHNGYKSTTWHGKITDQHVIAYHMVHGYIPRRVHLIDGDKTNIKLDNLRGSLGWDK